MCNINLCRVSEANESTPILIDIDECDTFEKVQNLLKCSYTRNVAGYCDHQYDAAVQCGKLFT